MRILFPQIGYIEIKLDRVVDNPLGLWLRYNISGKGIQTVDYYNSLLRRTTNETPFNGILIPQGQNTGRIYFSALPDAIKEEDEQITVTLIPYKFDGNILNDANNSNYRIASVNTQTLTIKDSNTYTAGVVILDSQNEAVDSTNPLRILPNLVLSDLPGTITAATTKSPLGEEQDKAFDNNLTSQWSISDKTGWIRYQFNDGKVYAVNQYTLTSAKDQPEADPKDWVLQGSNNGSNWVDLDKRSAETFANRSQTKTYNFTNSTAYQYYRLNVTKNNGGNEIQLGEIELKNTNFDLTDLGGSAYSSISFDYDPYEAFDNRPDIEWDTSARTAQLRISRW